MHKSEEILDIVNEKGEILSSLPRSKIHGNPSLIHRVVHVLLFNNNNDLFLQKRSMNKDVAPGKWDTSVGGHINQNETIEEALKRETKEELGIDIPTPKFLYTYIHSNPHETELVYTYSYIYNGGIQFARDEIDEVRAWSINEINAMLGKGIFSTNFEHEFSIYTQVYLNFNFEI
ncbi:NUDIX domain-containing protein [Candidatus Poribacteria bacterium]|nr:NUDIX domain-containing protein [Candidatus Poribacteria bacterium]